MPRVLRAFVLSLTLVLATACDNTPSSISFPNPSARPAAKVARASLTIQPPASVSRISEVSLSPRQVTLVPGQRVVLSALVTDAEGKPARGASLTWTVRDGAAGRVNALGVFTAGQSTGSFIDAVEVRATIGGESVSAFGSVEVTRPGEAQQRVLDSLVLFPPEVIVRQGQVTGVGALAWDADGRLVPGVKLSWAVEDERAGTIDSQGFFTGGRATGQYSKAVKVTAVQQVAGEPVIRVAYVNVTVTELAASRSLQHVVVVPSLVRLRPGDTVNLYARAFDQAGRQLRDVTFAWHMADPSAGTVNVNGTLTAGSTPGVYTGAVKVSGSQTGNAGTNPASGYVTVVVELPKASRTLDSVEVSPRVVEAPMGQRVLLKAAGLDAIGLTVPAKTTWETINPQAGSVSASGIFLGSRAPGFYPGALRAVVEQSINGTVIKQEALVDVAIIGPLERVVLVPDTATVEQGKSFRFQAIGYDAQGLEIPNLRYRWSVTDASVGSIDQTGLFQSKGAPGVYSSVIQVSVTEPVR